MNSLDFHSSPGIFTDMNSEDYQVLTALRNVLQTIRNNTPVRLFPFDQAASSDIRTGYVNGMPVRRLVITLRAPGCSWVTRSGGCAMCGHYAGTTRGVLPSANDTVQQFVREIGKYDISGIEVLSLYNSGSILNPDEISRDTLIEIFKSIRNYPSIRKVVLETRAEYVDPDFVGDLSVILGGNRSISIAMGLETADDYLREICLNKGCRLSDIAEAVASLKDISETQLYILAGLPFLTEAEAVEDAVTSIRSAHALGADEIHIEPVTLQKHTLTEHLVKSGRHRLISLYSIYEILRRVLPEIRPYVSPFLHMPLPERIPGGCPACSKRLVEGLLNTYNISRDTESLDYAPCTCVNEWRKRLKTTDNRAIPQRITDALKAISCEVPT